MDKEVLLEIVDLYVKIGDREVVAGINLKICRGDVMVLLGQNGSGKHP